MCYMTQHGSFNYDLLLSKFFLSFQVFEGQSQFTFFSKAHSLDVLHLYSTLQMEIEQEGQKPRKQSQEHFTSNKPFMTQ